MEYKKVASCASRIKEAMRFRKMKQADVCQATGIPKSALSQYTSGLYVPKQDRFYLLAKCLNVSEAWLMGLDVPMERQTTPSPEIQLSEGEKVLLDLFRRVPEESQQLVLQMIRAALGNQE